MVRVVYGRSKGYVLARGLPDSSARRRSSQHCKQCYAAGLTYGESRAAGCLRCQALVDAATARSRVRRSAGPA